MNTDYLSVEGIVVHDVNIDKEIGKKVRELRLVMGMSQDDLGKKVGVTFQQIQKYEKGINRIVVGMLYKLAKALGVTPKDLFPDTNSSSDNSASSYKTLHENGENFKYNNDENDEENVDSESSDAESKEILGLVREYKKIGNKRSRNAVYSLIKSLSSPEN
ncbi:MAG: hypothetical protein PG981_001165 [Wolbachia endosymbiont of Ctenocephalides orientis wCori]|nr:MAG: hypothetical protein PG981_001165 [Wolbachia endosymbiont of Ctenocephalides orientis wCori]